MNTLPVQRWQRFPVFFLLDTSQAMRGSLEVAMMQGLLQLRNDLQRHTITRFHVFLSCITFGEMIQYTHLQPLSLFAPHSWRAGGNCCLRPALYELYQAFQWDFLVRSHDHPGDYAPLIILVLGDSPADSWQDGITPLQTIFGQLHARVVTLITNRHLSQNVRWLGPELLLLDPARGEGMSNFFEWATSLILNQCSYLVSGTVTTSSTLPTLPYGIINL